MNIQSFSELLKRFCSKRALPFKDSFYAILTYFSQETSYYQFCLTFHP